jgi:hypothetical protein
LWSNRGDAAGSKEHRNGNEPGKAPEGFCPLAALSMDDLKKDTEHDPEGAEEFVALMRQLRQPDSRPVKL